MEYCTSMVNESNAQLKYWTFPKTVQLQLQLIVSSRRLDVDTSKWSKSRFVTYHIPKCRFFLYQNVAF